MKLWAKVFLAVMVILLNSCASHQPMHPAVVLTQPLDEKQELATQEAGGYYDVAKQNVHFGDYSKAADNYWQAAEIWEQADIRPWAQSAYYSASYYYKLASENEGTDKQGVAYLLKADEAKRRADKLRSD